MMKTLSKFIGTSTQTLVAFPPQYFSMGVEISRRPITFHQSGTASGITILDRNSFNDQTKETYCHGEVALECGVFRVPEKNVI
jgi:hypothetical protein